MEEKTKIGIECKIKIIEIIKDIKLNFWIYNQEVYRNLIINFYTNSQCVIINYNISNKHTFNSITKWIEELKLTSIETQIVLIGNNWI